VVSETSLINCENLPEEMANSFDEPWHFVGEISAPPDRLGGSWWIEAICVCQKIDVLLLHANPLPIVPIHHTTLRGYKFVTDDMIETVVYFGRCEDCGRVHWARQGPPFRRARCYAGVEA
jgi:hypothetical protein